MTDAPSLPPVEAQRIASNFVADAIQFGACCYCAAEESPTLRLIVHEEGCPVLTVQYLAELAAIPSPQTWQPPIEARTDLDMLQVDRLRAWARNIREHGADIGQWGSPAFVADECERIAADVERAVKRWKPTCAPDCVDCADEQPVASPRGGPAKE